MNAHERHRNRTLWLTGVLHAFTHVYQVALMPLYLLIQRDFKFASVGQATLLLTVMMAACFVPSWPSTRVSGRAAAALFAHTEGFQVRQRRAGNAAADGDDGSLFCAELSHWRAGGQAGSQEAARFWARCERAGLRGTGTGTELRVGVGGGGRGRVRRQFLSPRGDGDGSALVSAQYRQGAGIGWHRGRRRVLRGADLCRLASGHAGAGIGPSGLAATSA